MNIPEKFWNAAMGALGLLTIFLIVISIKEIKTIGYVGTNPNLTNTITVSGKGEVMAVPDIATFSFSVTEEAKTVAEAQTKATEKSNNALKAIREGGVEDKDIKTTSYNINPRYEYTPCTQWSCPANRQNLIGYEVSQTVEVKVRDLEKAGALFASIGSIGVQNVQGLNFTVDNPDSVNSEARAKAIADAKSKANALAKQLGVSLVRVVSYSEGSYAPVYRSYAAGAANLKAVDEAAVPEIPVGENKVTSNVEVVYQIK